MARLQNLRFGCKLLLLALALTIAVPACGCEQDPTQAMLREEAGECLFSLPAWHLDNLPPKIAQAGLAIDPRPLSSEGKAFLHDFFQTRAHLECLQSELQREVVLHGAHSSHAHALTTQVQEVRYEYASAAPRAELLMQQAIASALDSLGLAFPLTPNGIVFPPVLLVLQQTPKLLVVSPRDQVQRLTDVLLSPALTIEEMEALESEIRCSHGLSAIVVTLGGLATYPSLVTDDLDLYHSVSLAAHEWTHQYLFFFPLGRSYFRGGIMREVNEAVADLVAREVADVVCGPSAQQPSGTPAADNDTTFDFAARMHTTRLTLDRLLEQGKIVEAEEYLEQQRQIFVANGYHIRKLNQAYFAFYGTYAFSPASVSPVGEQLMELRNSYDSLGKFLTAVRQVTTYDDILDLLHDKCPQESLAGSASRQLPSKLAPPTGTAARDRPPTQP